MKGKLAKESKEIKLKSGSSIQFYTLKNDSISIVTIPAKRKHHQPKRGHIAVKRETAMVICAQLLVDLNLPISQELENEILRNIDHLVDWPEDRLNTNVK
jgi:hypothetical protein